MAVALTGVGATGAPGTATPRISIALTGVLGVVRQGDMLKDARPGEAFVLAFPMPQLAMTGVTGAVGTLSMQAPAATMAMVGDAPQAARVALELPMPQMALAGVTGSIGTLAMNALLPTMRFGDGARLVMETPQPVLQLSGVTGVTGQLTLRPSAPLLQLSGLTEAIGQLTLRQPMTQLALTMASGTVGVLRMAPRPAALRFAGVLGTTGSLSLRAPAPTMVLTGFYAAIGVLTIKVPMPRMVLRGTTAGTAQQVSTTRMTYALQTERLALTQYTNFPFNSFAVFNGRVLGASEDGIYELTGDTDAGEAIEAHARLGVTDLGTSRVKRVERVYVAARTPAAARALLLRVTTNETQQRDYAVKTSISAGLHTTRVDLGHGVESRYWQFELRNRDGADFNLDTLEVAPTVMRRRLGAKDA